MKNTGKQFCKTTISRVIGDVFMEFYFFLAYCVMESLKCRSRRCSRGHVGQPSVRLLTSSKDGEFGILLHLPWCLVSEAADAPSVTVQAVLHLSSTFLLLPQSSPVWEGWAEEDFGPEQITAARVSHPSTLLNCLLGKPETDTRLNSSCLACSPELSPRQSITACVASTIERKLFLISQLNLLLMQIRLIYSGLSAEGKPQHKLWVPERSCSLLLSYSKLKHNPKCFETNTSQIRLS